MRAIVDLQISTHHHHLSSPIMCYEPQHALFNNFKIDTLEPLSKSKYYKILSMSTPPANYKPPPLPSPFTNTSPAPLLLTQGAEAHVYKTTFLTPSTPAALKIRPSKPYRHPILDRRLTRQRILQEARCLVKLVREGVNVPAVLAMDWEGNSVTAPSLPVDVGSATTWGGAWLLMEWIEGLVVRVVLERWEAWMRQQRRTRREEDSGHDACAEQTTDEEEIVRVRDLMRRIGHAIGALHKAGVIHGDLTTSNLMLRPSSPPPLDMSQKEQSGIQAVLDDSEEHRSGGSPSMEGDVVLIDFGLASQSVQDEDRAVDLYVLERAFGSTHPRTESFFGEVLDGYRESYKGATSALKRLEDVRMRGRKRSMLG